MAQTITPEVLWAQRSSSSEAEKNHIFLTISVPDVPPKDMKLDIQPTKVIFTGYSESKKTNYHVELELFKEIEPEKTKTNHTSRDLELVLQKKELDEAFWPRLLKENKKMHFLRTDFDKWVDEDEQNEVGEDDDYMSRMGGMGGMGADGGFGGIDFSKLGAGGGGMGGMPDMGAMGDMGDMGGDEDEDEDDDDDEMPELEGEEESAGKGKEKVGGAEAATPAAKSSLVQEAE